MVVPLPSKQEAGVRFPLLAQNKNHFRCFPGEILFIIIPRESLFKGIVVELASTSIRIAEGVVES